MELNALKTEEGELNEMSRRFLSAGAAYYGPDSSEYEMLGGTRQIVVIRENFRLQSIVADPM